MESVSEESLRRVKRPPRPEVPPPLTYSEYRLQSKFFNSDMNLLDDSVRVNQFGMKYKEIEGCAYPAFASPTCIDRLRGEFEARPDDVFVVYPAAPILEDFTAYAVALVEQCLLKEVPSDDVFPRWLDGAASRRGWQYVETMQNWSERRVFTTHAPPWLFPCRHSFSGPPWARSSGSSARAGGGMGAKICVFLADPRYLVMKDFMCAEVFKGDDHGKLDFLDWLDAIGRSSEDATNLIQLCGGSIHTTLAWAEEEAKDPEHVRLFFFEDFILQPEVALRGLAKFLAVPSMSDMTEVAIKEATVKLKTPAIEKRPAVIGPVEQLVNDFERLISTASYGVQEGWYALIRKWSTSTNFRLAGLATMVLDHKPWDPPEWWALHSAQACRPCLFFPRGKCTSDECGFCHGPGHHKPKRASHAVRRARKKRYDRTPSPERDLDDEPGIFFQGKAATSSVVTASRQQQLGLPPLGQSALAAQSLFGLQPLGQPPLGQPLPGQQLLGQPFLEQPPLGQPLPPQQPLGQPPLDQPLHGQQPLQHPLLNSQALLVQYLPASNQFPGLQHPQVAQGAPDRAGMRPAGYFALPTDQNMADMRGQPVFVPMPGCPVPSQMGGRWG
jgi:hypothetical protein